MAVGMPPLHSQQLPSEVLPTYAFTYSFGLGQEFEEKMGNGEKGHITTYSEDDSPKVLPATRTSASSFTTSGNSIMLVIAAVH